MKFGTSDGLYDDELGIMAFDGNLEVKNRTSISLNYNSDMDSFIKCIHLKDELGVFAFYLSNYISSYYPVFLFKNYNYTENLFEDYFPSEFINISTNIDFNYNNTMNDIIKLSEKKNMFYNNFKFKRYIIYNIIKYYKRKGFIYKILFFRNAFSI